MDSLREAPRRIQLRRTKGWRMPGNTVSVARPTKWGNPYRVGEIIPVLDGEDGPEIGQIGPLNAKDAVECFEEEGARLGIFDDVDDLRGKNLACWCALDQPCHADVLLRLANQPCAALQSNGEG